MIAERIWKNLYMHVILYIEMFQEILINKLFFKKKIVIGFVDKILSTLKRYQL